jgi:outer membrane lipoprotein-sorting protein
VKLVGEDSLAGQAATKLELVPKTEDAKKYVTKLELWVPDHGAPYPLQEKIYEPSGDYRLITYSDVKINPPIKADAVKLKLPPGVKTQQK